MLQAGGGEEAVNLIDSQPIDLFVLDVMMPGKDGFEVCEEIRAQSDAIIVMLTAKAEEEDELTGYSYGADDYVTKPFSLKVLSAKIRVLLNRWKNEEAEELSGNDRLVIDDTAREVHKDGITLPLTSKEFELLRCLADHSNQVLTRDMILDRVWGMDYYGDVRTVDTHIKRLRRKLGDEAGRIVTVRGNGYKYR